MSPVSRKYLARTVTALSIVLLTAISGNAVSFESSDNIHISNLHRIDDDLFAWGWKITVDGVIEGDFIAAGNTVRTNGHVRGSENVAAFTFNHTGNVDGSLRGVVSFCEIDGYVGRSVMIVGEDLRVGEKATIQKDVIMRGATVHFDGRGLGNVDIRAKTVSLGGLVGGDAILEGGRINITAPAVIKGNLVYVTEKETNLALESGVIIMGTTEWKLPEKTGAAKDVGRYGSITVDISCLLAAFLFGVILLFLFNKYAVEATNQLRSRFAVATATGLLSVIVFAVCLFFLMLASALVVLGFALVYGYGQAAGVFVLALSILLVPITSFLTVSGGVLFYSGKIIIALLGGYWMVRMVKPQTSYLTRFQLLLGLIVLTALFAIPIVGMLIYIAVSVIGAGAIILGIKYCRKELAEH